MIDPKSLFQPHMPLETRPGFSRLCHWKRLQAGCGWRQATALTFDALSACAMRTLRLLSRKVSDYSLSVGFRPVTNSEKELASDYFDCTHCAFNMMDKTKMQMGDGSAACTRHIFFAPCHGPHPACLLARYGLKGNIQELA